MRCNIVVTWGTPWWRMFARSPNRTAVAGGRNGDALRCGRSASLWKHLNCWAASLRCRPARQSPPSPPGHCRQQPNSLQMNADCQQLLPRRAWARVRTCLEPVASSQWQPVSLCATRCDLTNFVPGKFTTWVYCLWRLKDAAWWKSAFCWFSVYFYWCSIAVSCAKSVISSPSWFLVSLTAIMVLNCKSKN